MMLDKTKHQKPDLDKLARNISKRGLPPVLSTPPMPPVKKPAEPVRKDK